ncbi:hypothetical protein PLESTF_000513900 [Pleodorina starrii]|nr:hypothetical protein PLESTF_000513900 [Pleodorina starrii]
MWLLRVAVAHKKILLVNLTRPSPLTDYLLPNEIDWTISGFDNPATFRANNPLSLQDFNDAVYEQEPGALERFRGAKFYVAHDN